MRDIFSQLPTSQQELARLRFRILQPYLEEQMPLAQIAETRHLSLRTVRRWLQQYQKWGPDGLVRATRADRGVRRGLPLEMIQCIETLAQAETYISVASLYRDVLRIATTKGWPLLSYSRVYDILRSLKTDSALTKKPITQALVSPQPSLLETKFYLPRLAPDLIERERLLAKLDEVSSHALTVVSAPAGFGKTALVGQWIAARRISAPPVWISLDSEDNDPIRFWCYVMTACLPMHPDVQNALFLLQTTMLPPFESSILDEALTVFLNGLAHSTGGVLVLDDYHLIREPHIQQMMTFFIEHLPETVHLLLITRNEPSLPLVRLRAGGNLCEILVEHLRFSPLEMQLFLQQKTPFPLSEQHILEVNIRLDGWAAGLRLLSLALQGQASLQEAEQTLTSFGGNNRPLQEYFVSEVLTFQSEEEQDFLLRTSMLDRFTASLCQSVTGSNESSQILKKLERAGIFLEPLDREGEWYRYHPLFAEAMRVEARQRFGEKTLQALFQRASSWFEQQGMLVPAIETILASGDLTRALVLIERYVTTIASFQEMYEYHTLSRWLGYFSFTLLGQSPLLCLRYATALVFVSTVYRLTPSTMVQLEDLLRIAERGLRAREDHEGLGELIALRALVLWRRNEIPQATTFAHQALSLLPEAELHWRSVANNLIGIQALLDGQLRLAHRLFQETHHYLCTATVLLGWVCFEQGQLSLAAEYYEQALREPNQSCTRSHAFLGLARIAYERNNLQAVEQYAQEAYLLGQLIGDEECLAQVQLLKARVFAARGDVVSSLKLVAELLVRIKVYQSPVLYQELQIEQARLQLMLGDLRAEQLWITERASIGDESLSPLQREREGLVMARFLLACGKSEQAFALLSALPDANLEAERLSIALEIQLLMALAEVESKQSTQAQQRVRHLLKFAQTEGYQRIFLDEGAPMAALLRGVVAHVAENTLRKYLQHVLQQFAQTDPPSHQEALSPQETRVLRLLARGHTAPQIAQELIVSINTVRTQTQSIYRKLHVNNRVAASDAARSLQLL